MHDQYHIVHNQYHNVHDQYHIVHNQYHIVHDRYHIVHDQYHIVHDQYHIVHDQYLAAALWLLLLLQFLRHLPVFVHTRLSVCFFDIINKQLLFCGSLLC